MVNNQIVLSIDHLHMADRVRMLKSDLPNMKPGKISILFLCLEYNKCYVFVHTNRGLNACIY